MHSFILKRSRRLCSSTASLPSSRVGFALVLCFLVTWSLLGLWTGVASLVAAVFLLAAIHAYDLTGEQAVRNYITCHTLAPR